MPEAEAEADPSGAGTGRVLLAFIVGQLGLHAAMAGLRMGAPLQALREGYGAWAMGWLMALFAAAPVLLALPAGRLADRWGFHRPVRIAVAVSICGMAMAVVACWLSGWLHFALLCGAATCTGCGANMSMLTIQRTAGLTARNATERMQIFSWLGIAPALANAVGPMATGLMIDASGFAGAYVLLMALPLVTLLATRAVPRVAPRKLETITVRPAWELMAAPGMKPLMAVNWLFSMCWDVHTFALPIIGHERGFSASTIGFVLGTFTLSVSGVRLLLPLLAHRVDGLRLLRLAMLGTAVVFVLYPLARTPVLMGLCAALLGLTLGTVQPVIMTTLHHLTPNDRHGEALAFRSMAINASSSLMPLLFGAMGTVLGAAVLFWGVGGAVGVGSWLVKRLEGVRT